MGKSNDSRRNFIKILGIAGAGAAVGWTDNENSSKRREKTRSSPSCQKYRSYFKGTKTYPYWWAFAFYFKRRGI